MSNEAMSIEDAMASGDPELIDQALAAHAGEDNSNEQDEAEAETPEETEAAEAEADSGDGSESDGESSGQDEEERAPIATKNGKHTIPYEVLEAARQREADLKRQLDEANARLSESDKQISNAKANLDRQGVDMDSAFADPDAITEKELADVEEDYGYGSMEAKLARILFKSQQAQTQQAEAVNQAQAEVDDAEAAAARSAFQNNSDLTNWQAKDPDRWDMALTIDQKLQADPKWQNAAPSDRFAEVAKRTKAAFGDAVAEQKSVKQRAKEIIDNSDPETPSSLSDIGQKPMTEKSTAERFENMSDEQIHDEISRMSESEYRQFLDQGFM